MSPAVTIAKLIGPTFVVLGVGMLTNQALSAEMVAEGVRNPILIFLTGVLTLVAGVAILNGYRAWTADWRVIITVLGWLFVLAGVIRIVLPQVAAQLAPRVYSGPVSIGIAGAVVLVIGGYLSFRGYRQ